MAALSAAPQLSVAEAAAPTQVHQHVFLAVSARVCVVRVCLCVRVSVRVLVRVRCVISVRIAFATDEI